MAHPTHTRRGAFTGEVLANEPICDGHFRLVIELERFPPTRPGQFVQIMCRAPGGQAGVREIDWPADRPPTFAQPELTDTEPLLRRPISLAGRRDHAGGRLELDVICRIVGTGTRWLARAKPGDAISVLGPLGNAFTPREGKPRAALVGGGVGIPPMLYLGEALAAAGKRVSAFCGARTAGLLPLRLLPTHPVRADGAPAHCVAEFAAMGIDTAVATDDGSLGLKGFVSAALERWLDAEAASADTVVHACGPEPMMRAVGDLCIARGIECQVALERHMACGMGTCQSCVVKIRDDSAQGWSYRLCCADGPVFDARDVVWD